MTHREALTNEIRSIFAKALDQADVETSPYRHWLMTNCLPDGVVNDLKALEFPLFEIDGVSGRREYHNKSRNYFDVETMAKHDACYAMAHAFQDPNMIAKLNKHLGIDLEGSNLRIEYAQDTDGFWLEPHTDIGVKLFTMLIYLSDDAGHEDMGTDIYASPEEHIGRSPFGPGQALIFIPAHDTWHGFEKRPINGVRKSIIINYVTPEWRAREQLCFPDIPVTAQSVRA